MLNAITTNRHLYAWGIISDNKCTFCRKHKETIVHLFVECEKVHELWSEVWNEIDSMSPFEASIDQSRKCILLSKPVSTKGHVYNLISLIVKQYIYRQRCLNKSLCSQQIVHEIRKIQSIEKYIAISNNCLYKHEKKWRAMSFE